MCKHEWENTKDGSLDKHCVKCGKKVKQGRLTMPNKATTQADVILPAGREIVKVPHYTGEKTVVFEAFKDDLVKEFNKSLNLSIINNPRRSD